MDFETFSTTWDDIEDIFTEENHEEDNPTAPIQLINAKSNPLQTLYLEYTDDLPEYPRSDMNGYSYVVAVNDRSQEEAESLVQDIQYSRASARGVKKNINSTFLNCSVKKWIWKCSGALVCEYLKPSLRTLYHTSLDEVAWAEIQNIRKNIDLVENDIQKRNAYSFYRSQKAFFQKGHACLETLPSCTPRFKRHFYPDVNGDYHPYIGCVNASSSFLQKHYYTSVKGYTSMDLYFLEQLFNESILPSQEECGVIEPLTSRRKYCDFDHVQGPGKLEHIQCGVIFTALVPVDIQSCPFIVFTSHGIHQHPPPPPHKPPELILRGVERIIKQMRNPSLTLAQFLRSPELEAFCQQYNASTPAEIHASLSNTDRISAIIQKQRLLSYPAGQNFNGVIYLYNTNPFIKEYIQEKYCDPNGTMILCGFKEQIRLLSTLTSFEVDMSYKRIRQKGMNEVVFATYLPEHGKIITLLRVFTDQETTEGYYLLFTRVFTLVQRMTGQSVEFNSIHSNGIYGIIVDMDTKQYTGLGQYLQEIDPLHRPILWQLQGIIIFCRVHFFRTITEAVGSTNKSSGVWSRMAGLIDCKSEDDYDHLCNLLIEHENEKVQAWAAHKKSPVIKAGLNKYCSSIPVYIYDSIRNHTNSAEQSHHKANAAGRWLTLTAAIQNSAKLDRQDILQYINRTDFNIHHSYRTANMETNYLRHMAREVSRKRRRSSTCFSSSSEPELGQRRSCSQPQGRGSSRSISSQSLRRVSSQNILSFEQQRQNIELRELELQLKEKEERVREKQLQNEEKELELMERRARLQNVNSEML
ncbi:uncharacterized protein EURHEDRAFT_417473 [Aspergillus ruber CBS 135680]|uniref:Uncharacterized protein n=1 Tax=Aspergillus ruber (strain CBS 135680) TaxID=1388766 RepID=A0A017S0N1_ASPRC|nr:uncharacterized protein EURHEDRAFT_417473 [Aspergillus ruber CBS 135680]EYE90406.1 hypothetical protein EURHEDRAFT_417473 [Aspergillus ruber CBS 135680]